MAEFPYINTVGKLREFVSKIPNMGVPESVNTRWLPTVGFPSNNHRPIITILKHIGFLDGNKPTERWRMFRDNTQAKQVMAQAIMEGYSDLFTLYPDAATRSDTELKNYFRGIMDGGDKVIAYTVSTFKTLCAFADFSNTNAEASPQDLAISQEARSSLTAQSSNVNGSHTVHLNIDIHMNIDASASSDNVDNIFASMARHLLEYESLSLGPSQNDELTDGSVNGAGDIVDSHKQSM